MAKVIGINCLFLIPNQVGGTEYHTRSYLRALQEEDVENSYIVFCNQENFTTIELSNPRWQKVLCPVHAQNRLWRLLYEQLVLPWMVLQQRCDVLHSFGYFGPVFTFSKRVITLHDINWRDCPEDFSLVERWALKIFIEANIKMSHAVITTSEFSQKRFLSHFPGFKNKCQIILSGVDEEFFTQLKVVKQTRPGKYFLTVSAFYPHKKVLDLLDIWEKHVLDNPSSHMVLVGKNGRDEAAVLRKLQELPSVEYLKKVDFRTLVSLYKFAEGFLFSSVYEGFGHPVYEALAARTRVFVSKKELFEQSVQPSLESLQASQLSQGEKKSLPLAKVPRYGRAAQQLIQLYGTL